MKPATSILIFKLTKKQLFNVTLIYWPHYVSDFFKSQIDVSDASAKVWKKLTRSVAPRERRPVECRANFKTLKILINLNTWEK